MVKKIVLWIITLGWAVLIFCFSAQPAKESSSLSLSVTTRIVNSLPAVRNLPPAEKNGIIEASHGFVRKLTHFSLYLVLGFVLWALLVSYGVSFGRGFWMALTIGTLYAVSDELHQHFIPGRSSEITDVLIDSFGVCTGSLLQLGRVYLWRLCLNKRRKVS